MNQLFSTSVTRFKHSLRLLTGICLLSLMNFAGLQACMSSSVTVLSTTAVGLNTLVTLQICVGTGYLGATAETRSIAIHFYSLSTNSNFIIHSFSPSSITGVFTGCTMPGYDVGPVNGCYGSDGTLMYIDPGYYGDPLCTARPFACTYNLSLCGPASIQCFTVSVLVNHLTDYIAVEGLESYTCTCNAMSSPLRLGAPLVTWGNVVAGIQNDEVAVEWDSQAEQVHGTYQVLRKQADQEYELVAEMPATGLGAPTTHYTHRETKKGLLGTVFYKVRFVDENGEVTEAPLVGVNLPLYDAFTLVDLYPQPAADWVECSFYSPKAASMEWKLIDMQGKAVARGLENLYEGQSSIRLGLESIAPGPHFLQCRSGNAIVTRKILKF